MAQARRARERARGLRVRARARLQLRAPAAPGQTARVTTRLSLSRAWLRTGPIVLDQRRRWTAREAMRCSVRSFLCAAHVCERGRRPRLSRRARDVARELWAAPRGRHAPEGAFWRVESHREAAGGGGEASSRRRRGERLAAGGDASFRVGERLFRVGPRLNSGRRAPLRGGARASIRVGARPFWTRPGGARPPRR